MFVAGTLVVNYSHASSVDLPLYQRSNFDYKLIETHLNSPYPVIMDTHITQQMQALPGLIIIFALNAKNSTVTGQAQWQRLCC